LASQLNKSEAAGRINDNVEFDPDGSEIFISADIGRRDTATWYFWQPKVGGYSIIDYDGGWGIDADDWCIRLNEKISKYKLSNGKPALGKIWLPHDARAKTFAAKHSAQEIFIKNFGPSKVDITPGSSIADRVQAARKIVQRCEFHETNCEQGLTGLRAWTYEYDDKAKIFSSVPKHDWASHDGDGFSYGCLIMSLYAPKIDKKEEFKYPIQRTFDEMVKAAKAKRQDDY
jgi:phage terminase large subunit